MYSHTLTCIPIHSRVFPYTHMYDHRVVYLLRQATCVGLWPHLPTTCPVSSNLCGLAVSLLTCLGVQALAIQFVSASFHDLQDDCTDSISLIKSLYECSRAPPSRNTDVETYVCLGHPSKGRGALIRKRQLKRGGRLMKSTILQFMSALVLIIGGGYCRNQQSKLSL